MNCHRYRCPECDDSLVHLVNRGAHESSSPLGQYVHDKLPNQFYWMDADGVIYKKATRIMRIIEHKFTGQSVSASQLEILPKLATMIRSAAAFERVNEHSGCYIVWTNYEFTEAIVERLKPKLQIETYPAFLIVGDNLKRFMSGDLIDSNDVKRVQHNLGRMVADAGAA